MKQPDELGGAEIQTLYVIVPDADALHARAKAAGARIVLDIKDEDYGGCSFSCRDQRLSQFIEGTNGEEVQSGDDFGNMFHRAASS